ncbi:MAG: TOBE domain-containing protein, partial [Acidobacteria bacterium]|nr:TOBE domain-containing protein [Acidobacteriota bacterium]
LIILFAVVSLRRAAASTIKLKAPLKDAVILAVLCTGAVIFADYFLRVLVPIEIISYLSRPVSLSVRPERIRFAAEGVDGDSLIGVIERPTYLGTDTRYQVRLPDGYSVLVRVQNAHGGANPVTVGDTVALRFDPGAVAEAYGIKAWRVSDPDKLVQTTVQADIYLTTPSWRAEPEATIDAELVSALAAHPGVVSVDRLRRLLVSIDNKRISLVGVDMDLSGGQSRFPLLKGDRMEVLGNVQQGGVLISEPLARKSRLDVGDLLQVYAGPGKLEFPIAGIYYDYTSELGSAAMDLAIMGEIFGPGPIHSLSLYLEEGRDPERVVDEIKARFPDTPLQIRSNQRLREEIFEIFDQTFAVVRILQMMSLLIAVCGIMLALLVLARERISELALYQALGASRLQIFRLFVGKGLGMGLIALGLGSAAGTVLAAILIFVINRTYFGWTIQVYWPGWPVLQQLATILTAALLASLYPAFRASKTPAVELSRDDLQ